MTTETNNAEQQAQAQLAGIEELMRALEQAQESGEPQSIEDYDEPLDEDGIRQAIEEFPLSVEVRSGWTLPGREMEAEEYRIVLCTGGPAVRIIGELDRHGEPDTAGLEYQDWFTGWTQYPTDSDQRETLAEFARCFVFEC